MNFADVNANFIRQVGQDLLLLGGVVMAVAYGLRRIYRMAKSVDEVLDYAKKAEINRALDLAEQRKIATNLSEHTQTEEARDQRIDQVINGLVTGQNEILREMRPNGGSSMKDVVNKVQRDVAVLKQWKEDNEHP